MIGTAGASLGKWARKIDANDGDPALIVDQRGTGDVLSLRDGGVVVAKVADGGAATFSGGGSDRFRINAAYNVTLFQATANYTLGWNNPAAARILTIPDPLGDDTFVFLAATQTLTNKTFTAPAIVGGSVTELTTFSLRSTGGNDLIIASTAAYSADRTLTINIPTGGNAAVTLAGDFSTSGAFALTLTQTAATNVTLPTTGTLATLAGTEEFTNKTLNASVGKGTWTASGTWVLPAFQLSAAAGIGRAVDTNFLNLIGGTDDHSARLILWGKSSGSPGAFQFQTPNAALLGTTRLLITGAADTVSATWSSLYHIGMKFGLAGTATGAWTMDGATSGVVTMTVAAAAGTWTMTLPMAVGTAGYFLVDAAGNGVTSWSNTLPAVTLGGDITLSANRAILGSASAFLMVAKAASPPAPDNLLHLWTGSAGVVAGQGNAPLVIEGSGNTFISLLAPNANFTGVFFGNETSNERAALLYDGANDRFDIRLVGATKLYYSAAAFAFQEATTISTTVGDLTLNPTGVIVASKNISATGLLTTYKAIATEGGGLPAIRKKPAILTGQTATVASVGAITTPNDAADHEYLVVGFLNITAYTSGTINLQVSYTDHAGVAQTKNITLAGDAGTTAGGATSGGYWQGLPIYISADPNTAITVKTAGTFTATYDVGAVIVQVV